LVSDIPAGDGNVANLFFTVYFIALFQGRHAASPAGPVDSGHTFQLDKSLFPAFSDGLPSLSREDREALEQTPGTPTKRQVSKRQVSKRLVSKRLVSKRLIRQVYKTSALQNIRCQNIRSSKRPVEKKTSIYILYLWLVEIRRFYCSHVCRLCFISILEGFLPYITIISSNK
jgi:hypothetical protein